MNTREKKGDEFCVEIARVIRKYKEIGVENIGYYLSLVNASMLSSCLISEDDFMDIIERGTLAGIENAENIKEGMKK